MGENLPVDVFEQGHIRMQAGTDQFAHPRPILTEQRYDSAYVHSSALTSSTVSGKLISDIASASMKPPLTYCSSCSLKG